MPRSMPTEATLGLWIVVQSYQVIMAWNWWQECAHEHSNTTAHAYFAYFFACGDENHKQHIFSDTQFIRAAKHQSHVIHSSDFPFLCFIFQSNIFYNNKQDLSLLLLSARNLCGWNEIGLRIWEGADNASMSLSLSKNAISYYSNNRWKFKSTVLFEKCSPSSGNETMLFAKRYEFNQFITLGWYAIDGVHDEHVKCR